MEVTDDLLVDLQEVNRFDLSELRTLTQVPLGRSVFAPSRGVLQHVYTFHHGYLADLSLRRTLGLPRLGSVFELVWVEAQDAQGESIYIGVESEYVYERTGMLITPGIASYGNQQTIPVYAVMQAVLFELEPILGFEVRRLLHREDLPDCLLHAPIQDYMALDHKGRPKLLIVSSRGCLDQMESEARNYCYEFLDRQREWSKRIRVKVSLGLYPVKRMWSVLDLSDLEVGDLLAMKGTASTSSSYLLFGFLQLRQTGFQGYRYEAQYTMNDDDLSLEFAGQSINDFQESKIEMDVPPHERIELDVLIGHTSIPLGELCAVQSGTLIELGQHSLPMVTLCVNGEPVLEGELVHFKDQLMVQVSKKLA